MSEVLLPSLMKPSLPATRYAPAWRDTAVVAVLTLAALLLSAHFQGAETLYALTRRWEFLQVDELPTGLLVLATGLIWLSWRRYRQARAELRARYGAEAALSAALAENRRLAQEHLRIQEAERKHLALELHDQLGQYLNAIKLDAVSIADTGGTDTQVANRAAQGIMRSVNHVHGAVSDMIRRLRPVGLDELGLTAAIEHCVDQWRVRLPATTFALCIRGSFEALSEPLTLTLYRLIQEGLTNVYKHAGARRVDVVLEYRGTDELVLVIADDGRGLPAQRLERGFGLAGMRERVELAGGSLSLSGAPGQGLRIEARLPAQAATAQAATAQAATAQASAAAA